MKTIKVFCLDSCEYSNHLKQEYWDNDIIFEEVYLGRTRAIHDLRNGGLSQARAPVLQVREQFYTGYDLFPGVSLTAPFWNSVFLVPAPFQPMYLRYHITCNNLELRP